MCDDRIIRRLAGVFILASLALAWWLSPLWILFTAFVGANLLQSSFTGCCPLERVLGRLRLGGCSPACAADGPGEPGHAPQEPWSGRKT